MYPAQRLFLSIILSPPSLPPPPPPSTFYPRCFIYITLTDSLTFIYTYTPTKINNNRPRKKLKLFLKKPPPPTPPPAVLLPWKPPITSLPKMPITPSTFCGWIKTSLSLSIKYLGVAIAAPSLNISFGLVKMPGKS